MLIKTSGVYNNIQNWIAQFLSGMQNEDLIVPYNILTLFRDEEQSIRYLSEMRWFGNVECPCCRHSEIELHDYNLQGYKCGFCDTMFYPWSNTDIEDFLHVPIRYWMFAICYVFLPISSISLQHATSVVEKTLQINSKDASEIVVRSYIILQSGALEKNKLKKYTK